MIEYESTIVDAAQPHIRLYMRSKIYKKDRIVSSLVSCIVAAGTATIILKLFGSDIPYWGMALAAIFGGISSFTNYSSATKKRILKSLERDHGTLYPMKSMYSVNNGQIIANSNGMKISFILSELTNVTEDDDRLELFFDGKGICVIPLRAFSTKEQKLGFLEKIQNEIAAPLPKIISS